jgi:hypothetical protein
MSAILSLEACEAGKRVVNHRPALRANLRHAPGWTTYPGDCTV